ncbi:helix-turn-helix transcriptional regulator [Bdellovibrio sp. NC01]|uniref:helix-turn-helix domain-containing protein n=1 Tax=Bdellovibrio sp. NC01 TaxID=2220073 RepID=UPI001159706B|nr:helix-turn-helix transcriptional regulator [Bdellovibrio sp. NC01]QDK38017.1 hypothetical protein DOE51_10670 [Bdellovibrio sp. NC01]
MSLEYIEICPDELRKQLRERGLTHADLASMLGLSTKSVQRWLNQSIKRMKIENLEKLAKALNIDKELITKQRVPFRPSPLNRSFEDLCSEHLVYAMAANEDWKIYASLLRSYGPKQLPSVQEAYLYKNLGIASLRLGKMNAAKVYLDKAVTLSESNGDYNLLMIALTTHQDRCHMIGDYKAGIHYYNKATEILPKITSDKIASLYLARTGKFFTQCGRVDEAVFLLRRALSRYYKTDTPNVQFIAFCLSYLTWAYLRARNYKLARTTAKRALRASHRAGWIRGQSLALYTLGILTYLQPEGRELRDKYFGKGRAIKRHIPNRPIDAPIEKLEFLRHCLNQDFEKAKNSIVWRLKKSRRSNLYFSYAILDALFLAKLDGGVQPIRSTFVDRAEEVFTRMQTADALEALKFLKSKSSITQEDLLKYFVF